MQKAILTYESLLTAVVENAAAYGVDQRNDLAVESTDRCEEKQSLVSSALSFLTLGYMSPSGRGRAKAAGDGEGPRNNSPKPTGSVADSAGTPRRPAGLGPFFLADRSPLEVCPGAN